MGYGGKNKPIIQVDNKELREEVATQLDETVQQTFIRTRTDFCLRSYFFN